MATKSTPGYRHQKHKNRPDRAFVEIGGQRHYLGRWDDPASLQLDHRVVQQWKATGCLPVSKREDGLTITELCARFWTQAKAEYPLRSATNFRPILLEYRLSLRGFVKCDGRAGRVLNHHETADVVWNVRGAVDD